MPQLYFTDSPFTRRMIGEVDQLRRPYRPTPWLYNAHLQILWVLLREALAPALRYERNDVLSMRDGGTTALHWLGLSCEAATPTLVLLHSIIGDARSTRVIARELHAATGWRIAVCIRRGHGGLPLTAPRINTMGSTDDLREQLSRIRAEFPSSPLYAVGVSAGSALLVRYLGEEAGRSMIRAGVAYCPGYDLRVAWGRTHPFYSRLMAKRLRRYLLAPHDRMLRTLDAYGRCVAARDLAEFHEHVHALAGWANQEEYLARTNPTDVMRRIAVPVLILNAEDDPVCVKQNVVDHAEAIRGLRDALLVTTAHGSHCAFFEGWGARPWSHRLIANYLLQAHKILDGVH